MELYLLKTLVCYLNQPILIINNPSYLSPVWSSDMRPRLRPEKRPDIHSSMISSMIDNQFGKSRVYTSIYIDTGMSYTHIQI